MSDKKLHSQSIHQDTTSSWLNIWWILIIYLKMLDSLNSRDRGRDWLTLWGPHCTRLSCRTGETCDSVGDPPSTRSTPVSLPVDTRYQTPASSSLWKNHICLQVLKPEYSNTTNMQETKLKSILLQETSKEYKIREKIYMSGSCGFACNLVMCQGCVHSLPIVDEGTITTWGPVSPSSRRWAMKAMVWMVFPSPWTKT